MNDKEIKPINRRIAHYRNLAGYTQETAAEALGMKKNTYARMERYGNPNSDMLIRLAMLFHVSIGVLLLGVETTVQEQPIIQIRQPDPPPLGTPPPIVLSTTEASCIKVCRLLTKEQQQQVMDLINRLYEENKK